MGRKILIKNVSQLFTLWEEDGVMYLEVVCGGIAMYERVIKLNGTERERYAEIGETYISRLAREIAKHESRFTDRFTTHP